MKKTICLAVTAAMLLSFSVPVCAEDLSETYDTNGITVTYPEELMDSTGVLYPYPAGTQDGIGVIAYTYVAMPKEDYDELFSKDMEDWSWDDMALFASSQFDIAYEFSADGGRDFSAVVERFGSDVDLEEANFIEIGKAEDTTFYVYADPKAADEVSKNAGQEYAEEFPALQETLVEALKNAEVFVPSVPGADMIGRKISFETTDVDGNPVSSEDIFAEHEVTMINFWQTWCGPCQGELGELAEMNSRLADKNAAVIGVCLDADEATEECKALLEENHVDYLNLMPFEGVYDELEFEGYPTSYFVDSEGTILAAPYVGAPQDMSSYERVIDQLLEGKEADVPDGENPVHENDEDAYRVIVKDVSGNPVEGAAVQFCSDETCMVGKTDENGIAAFSVPEGIYTVHLLKAPEGYEAPGDEYVTSETFCDVCVTLQNA